MDIKSDIDDDDDDDDDDDKLWRWISKVIMMEQGGIFAEGGNCTDQASPAGRAP